MFFVVFVLAYPNCFPFQDSEIMVEAEGQRAAQNSSSAPSSVCSLVHSDSTILQAHINSLEQRLEVRHPMHTGEFKMNLFAAQLSALTGTLIMFAISSTKVSAHLRCL